MAILTVKLPNGETQEMSHPDDWTDEQVQAAIHEQFPDEGPSPAEESQIPETPFNNQPAEKPEVLGWEGLKQDAQKYLSNALKSAGSFALDTPGMIEELGGELLSKPLKAPARGLGVVGAAATNLGKETLNLPSEIISELGRKKLIPEWLKKYADVMKIPEETGLQKALFGEERPGDRLLNAVPAIASVVTPIGKKLSQPSKTTLLQRSLEDQMRTLQEKGKLTEADTQALKDSLRAEFSQKFGKDIGELSPTGQEVKANIKEKKIEELKPVAEIPEEVVGEIPPEPDIKGMLEEHKNAIENAKTSAEENLGIREHPTLKAGSNFKKSIEKLHDSTSDLYKKARQVYVDKKISADNSKEIKSITDDLEELKAADELAPGYGSGTAEQKALQSQIDALKGEKVNASDIFDLQQTLEKMAQETRNTQYSGVNQLEFKRLGKVAERLDSHADSLSKRLEEVGGKDVQKMIKEANKGWKTYKDLTKRNPIGKAALKGDIPSNTLIELAKDHPGNEFLNGLVQSNPELKKHVLAAYTGTANINKLVKPTTLAKKYLEELPEVEEHVMAFKNAVSNYKAGETKASKIKSEYDALVKSMKDAAAQQKSRVEANEKIAVLRKEVKAHRDAIPKLKERIKVGEAEGKNMSKLKDEMLQHQRKMEDKNGLIQKISSLYLRVKGVQGIANKIGL